MSRSHSRRPHGLEQSNVVAIDRIHGGVADDGIIDFSASINPLGPPASALVEYHAAARMITAYPPAYPEKLSARIADWLGIGREQVIVGSGSTQLIHLFARVYRLMTPYVAIPTFSEFANAIALNGSTPYALELSAKHAFTLRYEQVAEALRHHAQAVFIGRPNSPTGSMIPAAEAEQMVRECGRFHAFCVLDEAFIDFADRAESIIGMMRSVAEDQRQGLVVIGSLTKIFAIPGLRIGFLAGPAAVIAKLREHLEPWSLNIVAERVALACLEEAEEFAERTRRWLRPERAYLQKQLASLSSVQVVPSAANFLMLMIDEKEDRESFGQFTLRRGIAVRDLRTMPGCSAGMYRVAVRLHEENARLIAAASAYSAQK